MKRAHAAISDATLFSAAPLAQLHPALSEYLASAAPQTARLVKIPTDKKYSVTAYEYSKGGRTIRVGGLRKMLEDAYYKHYKDNRSKRKFKTVNVKGSTNVQGKVVDRQLAAACTPEGRAKVKHPMAVHVMQHLNLIGHTVQAGQVPVELVGGSCKMTQADLITRDKNGKLWCIEIKSGMPVGFFHKQGTMTGRLAKHAVDCTKLNIWHLQLAYTRASLVAAGVPVEDSMILQVYEDKKEGLVLKPHHPPDWVKLLFP